jgi:CDGSH-type Zn-finger protein
MMDIVSRFVKVSLPKYLKSLPLPDTVGGFAQLSASDIVTDAIFSTIVLFILYAVARLVVSLVRKRKPAQINFKVKKDNPKVVDLVEVEDLAEEKITYCRCWKSSKFPLCDGTHNKHNEETKDNIGPLVLKRKEKK